LKRLLPILLLIVVAIGIVLDPYTFHETASDDMTSAPIWQTGLALVDLGLVLIACGLIWRRAAANALGVVVGEAVYNLVLVSVQVAHHKSRFLMGVDSHQYLSAYLFVIGLRFLSIPLIVRLAMHPGTSLKAPLATSNGL
jgi:hypothetical protein